MTRRLITTAVALVAAAVDVAWADGHPVTELIAGTIFAVGPGGAQVGPAALSRLQGSSTLVYEGALRPGSWQVTVDVAGDAAVEPDETFFLDLSNPVNATIGDGRGGGIIQMFTTSQREPRRSSFTPRSSACPRPDDRDTRRRPPIHTRGDRRVLAGRNGLGAPGGVGRSA